MKQCTKCKEIKMLSEFYKEVAGKDDPRPSCKTCCATRRREYYAKNPDYFSEYRAANAERIRKKDRAYGALHREEACERTRKWQIENPEAVKINSKRRRARKKGCDVRTVTAKDYKRIMSALCYLCGIAPSATEEHIIPLSRGGRHSIGNLLGACGSCNSRKHSRLLVEYRRYLRVV